MSDEIATTTHKFKLVGVNEGKTIRLGPNKMYSFVKGVLTVECNNDDAKRIQHMLGKFYSAKRVRAKNEVIEDDEPETTTVSKPVKPAK